MAACCGSTALIHTNNKKRAVRTCSPQIPIPMYLMTHAYFCFYPAVSNVVLRRVRRFGAPNQI